MVPRAPRPAIAALLIVLPFGLWRLLPGRTLPTRSRRRAEALAYDLDHAGSAEAAPSEHFAGARRSARSPRAGQRPLAEPPLPARRGHGRPLSRLVLELDRRPEEAAGRTSTRSSAAKSAKAIELAEQRVAAHPNDAQAHYDLGAAVGLQASYVATVEGRMLAGFRAARRAYDEHERVLALDPSRKDAGLIVGTYRYVVSTLSLPMRMMAYVAGFGGGRDVGIRMIEEAAASPSDSRMDAMFALVLMYNRERRYDDALRVLQELRRLHPRNRLVLLEAGSTALRAGARSSADATPDGRSRDAGCRQAAADPGRRRPVAVQARSRPRGARAARMRPPRTSRLRLDRRRRAWVQGRARVELGANRAGAGRSPRRPPTQARQAETLCEQGHDPVCVEDARKMLRSARWPVRSKPGSGSSSGVIVTCILGVVADRGRGLLLLHQAHRDAHGLARGGYQ